MFELTNHDHVRIYTDTLMALARDARVQGKREVYQFIAGYLAPFGLLQVELWQETDGANDPPIVREACSNTLTNNAPHNALRDHVSGAIARGEKTAVRESESIKW